MARGDVCLRKRDAGAGSFGTRPCSLPDVESSDEASRLIALCESGFERDVYNELFNRGYHAIPQGAGCGLPH